MENLICGVGGISEKDVWLYRFREVSADEKEKDYIFQSYMV